MTMSDTALKVAGTIGALAGLGFVGAALATRRSAPARNPTADERREANFYCPYGNKDKWRARKAFLAAGVPNTPETMQYFPATRMTTGTWLVFVTLDELIAIEDDLWSDRGKHGVHYDALDMSLYEDYMRYNRRRAGTEYPEEKTEPDE